MDQDEHEAWKGETTSRGAAALAQYEAAQRRIETAQGTGLDALAYGFGLVRYVEDDPLLRARVRRAVSQAPQTGGSVSHLAEECLPVLEFNKPEGVSLQEAQRGVAVYWLRAARPRGLLARFGWWWRLWRAMR